MRPTDIMTAILLICSTAGSAFTADEAELFERRSEVRANLHAAYDVICDGEKEILDFRLTDLTGFWHGSPSVGSGYSNLFLLFDDGSFVYRESSMDGSSRLRELSGRWLVEGNHLVLEADSAVFLEGGEIVEPYASWGSDYVIEGADMAGRTLIGMELLRLPMDGYTSNYAESSGAEDYEHLTVPYMRIGIRGYWRMHRDPDMEGLDLHAALIFWKR